MRTIKRAILASGVAAFALIGMAPSAFAQASDTSGKLGEIVVTARKRSEALQTVPISVTAFTAQSLDRLNINTAEKIAQFTPNLTSAPTVGFIGGSSFSIRGIGEHEVLITGESPVAEYLDGVYIAGLTTTNFDLVDVQRIEVLRGPQGTLFGRNTTGGAINIVTKVPSDDFGAVQKFTYGSYNQFVSRTQVNTGKLGTSGLKAIISYQHRQMDGYVNNVNTRSSRDPGAINSDALWFKLNGSWGAVTANYSLDYNRLSGQTQAQQISFVSPTVAAYYGLSPGLGGETLVVDSKRLQNIDLPAIPNDKITNVGHALTLQYDIDSANEIKSISGYRRFSSHTYSSTSPAGILGPTVTGVAEVTPYLGKNAQHLTQYSEELQLIGNTKRLKYVAGLYYFHDRAVEDEFADLTFLISPTLGFNTTSSLLAAQKTTSESAYGQVSYTPPVFSDKLELTGGLRYTRDTKTIDQSSPLLNEDTRRFHNLSYNLTANYQWTRDFMSYVRVASGYRSGGYNLRAQAGQGVNFSPEAATVYEGGVKTEWFQHRLRANLSVFYTKYDDLQVAQFTGVAAGSAGGVKNANANYAGFELELQARPTEGLTLDGSVGYVHPEYKSIYFPNPTTGALQNYASSAHFPYVPEWTSHVGAQYEHDLVDLGKLILRLDYSHESEKYFFTTSLPTQNPFNDLIKSPGQDLVSARLILADVSVGGRLKLETSLWAENLLNDKYVAQGVDYGPALGFATKTYAIPRTIGIDLKITY